MLIIVWHIRIVKKVPFWNRKADARRGDVLSTYIYRISLGGGTSFELSTAINLVLQVLGLIVVLITNKFVSKLDIMGIF